MPLPFKVKSLDTVPEGARSLYEKRGEEFVLPVEGVRPEEEFAGLKQKLDGAFGERDRYKERAEKWTDEDEKEYQRLRKEAKDREEKKLKDEGQWESLRTQLQTEHQTALGAKDTEIKGRDEIIQELTVTNELLTALSGVREELRAAAQALLEKRGPKVKWIEKDGRKRPVGVFPDAVHGDQPIGDYVAKWLTTDEAKPYLPGKTKQGGGAPGTGGKGGGSGKSYEGKAWKDMTMEEKKEYTEDKYGAGAASS